MKSNKRLNSHQIGAVHAFCALALLVMIAVFPSNGAAQDTPPAKDWPAAAPGEVGLDAAAIAALDADLAGGKYGLVDSMLVIRCGKQAFEHSYARDYDKI